jgi:hypothetical protein
MGNAPAIVIKAWPSSLAIQLACPELGSGVPVAAWDDDWTGVLEAWDDDWTGVLEAWQ